MVTRQLYQDVGGSAEAVKTEPLGSARHVERAVSDQTRTKQGCGLQVGISGRNAETETVVRHTVLGEATVDLVAGIQRTIAKILLAAAAKLAAATAAAQPRDSDPVTDREPCHCGPAVFHHADDLMSRYQRQAGFGELTIDHV